MRHCPFAADGTSQEDALKKELFERGPFYIAFWTYADFSDYKSGIYSHQGGSKDGSHAVTLVGWGAVGETRYWILQK